MFIFIFKLVIISEYSSGHYTKEFNHLLKATNWKFIATEERTINYAENIHRKIRVSMAWTIHPPSAAYRRAYNVRSLYEQP